MKIGFERERKAGLTDYQMQRLFNTLSFLSLNENNTRFPKYIFQQYLHDSAKYEKLPDNLEDLLIDDITNITALIVRDGFDQFSFTHKSIQEYFAAVFIFMLGEERKINFYNQVIDDLNAFRKWQNTLAFLETIDERNYTKYFLLPYKKNALCLDDKSNVNINYSSLMKLIGSDSKVRVAESGELIRLYWGDTFSSVLYIHYSDFAKKVIKEYLETKSSKLAEFLSYCDESDYIDFQDRGGDFVFVIDKFIKENKLQKDVSKFLSNAFEVSPFKADVLVLETEINSLDKIADDILPF
jgi:hypothetical protein